MKLPEFLRGTYNVRTLIQYTLYTLLNYRSSGFHHILRRYTNIK